MLRMENPVLPSEHPDPIIIKMEDIAPPFLQPATNHEVPMQMPTWRLQNPIADKQQRDRIAMSTSTGSKYAWLVCESKLKNYNYESYTVRIFIKHIGTQEPNIKLIGIQIFEKNDTKIELKMKTPSLLSNRVDIENRTEQGETGFCYIIKIIGINPYTDADEQVCQFESNVFRTVSHSKQVEYKKRSNPKKRSRSSKRSSKRQKIDQRYDESEDDSEYIFDLSSD